MRARRRPCQLRNHAVYSPLCATCVDARRTVSDSSRMGYRLVHFSHGISILCTMSTTHVSATNATQSFFRSALLFLKAFTFDREETIATSRDPVPRKHYTCTRYFPRANLGCKHAAHLCFSMSSRNPHVSSSRVQQVFSSGPHTRLKAGLFLFITAGRRPAGVGQTER